MSFAVLAEIPFGEPKINHVNFILVGASANQKIVRLYIPMQDSSRVNKLNKFQHFKTNHQSGFEGKLSIADVQHFFERLPQIVHHHHVAISLSADIVHMRNVYLLPNLFGFDQLGDKFWLVEKLGSLRKSAFDFEGDFRVIVEVDGEVDLSECSFSEFPFDSVVLQHDFSLLLLGHLKLW